MAAVSPAGPEPTMMTSRILLKLSPLGLRPSECPEEQSGEGEDSAQHRVAGPDPAREQVDVQQAQHADGRQPEDHQGDGGGDEPIDERPGHQGQRSYRLVAYGDDDGLDGLGGLGGPVARGGHARYGHGW